MTMTPGPVPVRYVGWVTPSAVCAPTVQVSRVMPGVSLGSRHGESTRPGVGLMPRLHALELVPDRAGQDLVRRDWQALRDAGLPSQLDHHGATNTPHVTVVSAPVLPEAA